MVSLLASVGGGGCSLALDFDSTIGQPASQPSFCASHVTPPAIFCDDFDAEPLGAQWPKVEALNGSTANDPGASTSSPNSLLSVADPVGTSGRVRAVSTVPFPDITSTKVVIILTLLLGLLLYLVDVGFLSFFKYIGVA